MNKEVTFFICGRHRNWFFLQVEKPRKDVFFYFLFYCFWSRQKKSFFYPPRERETMQTKAVKAFFALASIRDWLFSPSRWRQPNRRQSQDCQKENLKKRKKMCRINEGKGHLKRLYSGTRLN